MGDDNYHGPINLDPAPDEAGIIIYGYIPDLGLSIVGSATFLLVLLVNLGYGMKRKGYRWFHGMIIVGSLMETGGYAARIYSHYRPFVVGSFVAQYFLIVVAPVLFSAAIYLSINLIVQHLPSAKNLLLIRAKFVLVSIIQILGAALIGSAESNRVSGKPSKLSPEQANDILLAGLSVQTFTFSIFLIILFVALKRAHSSLSLTTSERHYHIRSLLWVIAMTSLLILLRTVYRLAETGQGFFGFASTHESLFGRLEYSPVILALITWTGFPPWRYLEFPRALSEGRIAVSDVGEKGTTREISRSTERILSEIGPSERKDG
ncbi:hypothetical protein M231_07595 [Tremella mesenterica]|uniref:RTA1-domain-containing protein n=1 Tax=Tremella mesenterica TaxID=5217 RepID=A0A4Q1BAT6_TREME|nr:hypothetical protein M231_07595 [Tremella mesenterica]